MRTVHRRWPLAAALAGVTASAGCGTPSPDSAVLPAEPTPCSSRTSASPSPTTTPFRQKVSWRAEEREDGSVRMTVGDVAAAPRDDDAVRTADYRAPSNRSDCEDVRVIRVRGWWCSTTVSKIKVSGEIVVGGAEPRAKIEGGGFTTRCSGPLPGRLRQVYQVERDSWNGWRGYGTRRTTDWTTHLSQQAAPYREACPAGRVGTYNYRVTATVEIDKLKVGDSRAASPVIRADCGTGVS